MHSVIFLLLAAAARATVCGDYFVPLSPAGRAADEFLSHSWRAERAREQYGELMGRELPADPAEAAALEGGRRLQLLWLGRHKENQAKAERALEAERPGLAARLHARRGASRHPLRFEDILPLLQTGDFELRTTPCPG